jgi:ATP-binding cassette subfamily C protein
MSATVTPAADDPGLLRMSPGKPLVLGDDQAWYLVSGGSLDVFLVRSENGQATGQRHFLFTAKAGDTLCGLAREISGDWRLVAAGNPDSRVARIEAHGAPEADNWLANLTVALIGRPTLTARTETLAPAQSASFPAGTRLTAGDEVVWARLEQGQATFLDQGPGFGPVEIGTFTPLVGRAWITVVQEARFMAVDTADLLAQGLLAGAMTAFHGRVIAGLEARLADIEGQDRQRQAAKARCDRAALSGSLAKVASVLCPGKQTVLEAAGIDDPLFAACRLVAEASRIPLAAGAASGHDGHALERVNDLAVASGFRVRRVTLDKDWFRRDGGPLLVFRGEAMAPAAALPRGATRYDLYDPVTGQVTALDAAAAKDMAPGACMFYTPFPDRPLHSLDLLAFALRGLRADMLMILGVGGLAALLGLVTPILTGTVIDTIIPEADTGMLMQIGGMILVCAVASALFEVAKGIALLRVEGKIDARVQSAVTDRLLGLPTSFFKGYSSGDLAFRCLGINAIHTILSGVTVNTALAAIFSLANLALLFFYDWQLALVANVFVLANMILVGLISGFVVNRQRAHIDLNGRKQGLELEYLTGISKLRLTGAEPRAFGAWAEVFAKSSALGYQSGAIFNLVSAVNAAFPTLTSMALFYWFFHGRLAALSLGHFLSFYAAFAAFQVGMVQLVSVISNSLVVIPLYERAKPIFRTAPEVDATKAKPKTLQGDIEVNHVVFRYEPAGRPILSDLSIHVAPGEFVALVGDSGAGKSTMLRLLLGFEKPESGTVYYDGQDLRELDVRALRRRIGVVLQDDKPSAGSLFENIAGSANLSLDDAWEAARMVGLEEDIKAMPMGMQTVVPPGGAGFSGGQIQRLLIARALARRPGILFFDEATSALDNKTQAVVSQSIASLKVTRVVIAHRLSTVMGADRIYALRQGQVVETGTFEELMAKGGYFHELAKRQVA